MHILEKYLIPEMSAATEADDITEEVSEQMDNETTPDADSLDAQMNEIEETAGTDEEAEEEVDEAANEEEPNEEDVESDDESVEEDETLEDETESAPTFEDKNKIKNNLIYLHNIISNTINRLDDVMGQFNDVNIASSISTTLGNLREVKEMAYNILTNDIASLSYPDLLEKYISIKRVYEISIEMINITTEIKKKQEPTSTQ